jgi:serpin B
MNEKLNDALNGISDKHIQEAARPHKRRPYWIAAVAAVLAMVILVSVLMPKKSPLDLIPLANQVTAAEYPKLLQKPDYGQFSDDEAYYLALREWRQDQYAQHDQPEGYADSLTNFWLRSTSEFLTGEENQVYSPLNVYMALAMLAETTDGNSRRQILKLLGHRSIDQLREQVGYVWNAHYNNDGETVSVLANSLWLDTQYSFHRPVADTLAESYYASVFYGDLGTDKMDEQLRTWINNQTGGLLKEQAEELHLEPETVFALASTVYFKAAWEDKFSENATVEDTFHGYNGDMRASFMNRTLHYATYYWGDDFGAIYLDLTGNNKMWLILPDEGKTVEDVLKSDAYLRMTLDPSNWKNQAVVRVNLSLPKFDVAGQMDLIDGMKRLGVKDIFDSKISDFTTITNTPLLSVSKIEHAARVTIDEEGVEAAAFTVIAVDGNGFAAEEIDFTVDRPFLFVVSSQDNLPLFAGVVTEP